jgi:hypothetical protein
MKSLFSLSRKEIFITSLLAIIWVPVFVIHPMLSYDRGTSRNISVEVIRAPYAESDTLQYRWTGDVYRSCDISLRRRVVDAHGMIYMLETKDFPAVPVNQLGVVSFVLDFPVGKWLAEGPATYQVVEVPRCTWLQKLWPVSIEYPPVEFEVTNGSKK